ncbi:MAG: SAM-dependent methyltransferase, partial [Pseudomonadota bacterium]
MADSTATAVNWVEQGLVPDRVIRLGIRRLLKARLAELKSGDAVAVAELTQSFVDALRNAPLALLPEKVWATALRQDGNAPATVMARLN